MIMQKGGCVKITICTYDRANAPSSGPNAWLGRLLRFLRSKKVEAHILVIYSGNIGACPIIETLRELKIGFSTLAYQEAPYVDMQMKWILRQIRDYQPDVFVPNLVTPAYYAGRWCREAGIPTIGVLHSNDQFYMKVLDRFVRERSKFSLSAIVCVSKYLTEMTRKVNRAETIVRRISCGSPVPERCAEPPGDEMRLIYAGRLFEEQKRILSVTNAMCNCSRKISGITASIYGHGPEIENVAKIIDQRACNDRVKIYDPVSPSEIQNILLKHHVFLLLSDYEGLPVALLEAMACGLVPVCLSERSGVDEVIKHGHNGLLVKDRDKSVCAAVARLKTEKGFWENLSKAARKTVVKSYATEIENNKWLDLINKMASQSTIKEKIRVPLFIHLPTIPLPQGDFRRPAVIKRLKKRVSDAWMMTRLAVRPRARLREFIQNRKLL